MRIQLMSDRAMKTALFLQETLRAFLTRCSPQHREAFLLCSFAQITTEP